MAAVINLSVLAKAAQAVALKNSIDAGGAASAIDLYSGPIGDVAGSVKLAAFAAPYPCGTTNLGSLVFGTIPSVIALANGVAAWARFKTSAGDTVADVNVSSAGGTAFMRLNTTAIVKDGPVTIATCVFEF